jgi:antitoxin VapB
MPAARSVRLHREGRHQTLEIPAEFQLPGDEAILRRDGDRLIVEPKPRGSLLDWLATLEPVDADVSDARDELAPPRPVDP